MIGYIEGVVKGAHDGALIILVGGIGYKVAVPRTFPAPPGSTLSLWTHLAVREDALDLYGFATEEELKVFELLLTVSGIGPKSALAILNIAAIESLRSAISQGNAEYLTKVSGIGRKTAEKIVLELRDKIGAGSEMTTSALKGDAEALEAMRALGYTPGEAREALRKVPGTITGSSDRLREALKIIGS